MKSNVSTVEARNSFSELINNVAFGKKTYYLTRRGKKIAAVVPVERALMYEKLEKEHYKKLAMKAHKEAEESGVYYTLEEIRKLVEETSDGA